MYEYDKELRDFSQVGNAGIRGLIFRPEAASRFFQEGELARNSPFPKKSMDNSSVV